MSQGPLSKTLARVRSELWDAPADQFAGLNGLRAIACTLVAVYHVGIFSGQFPLFSEITPDLSMTQRVVNGSWVGVDIFFVLSGFLIGRILMRSHVRTGTLEFRNFFLRRTFRVFPAYYLVLTFGLFVFARLPNPIPWHILAGHDWHEVLANSWQNYTYTLNYFFSAGDANPMSWAWSLCVEEQFYLALPPILLFVFRFRSSRTRAAILALGVLIPPILRMLHYLADPDLALLDGVYYRTHNRADAMFYGVLIAYAYVFHREGFEAAVARAGNLTWIVGVLCIVAAWTFGGIQVRGFFAVVVQFSLVAIGAALLITNCLLTQNAFTRSMSRAFWYPFARVSYGTFLIHPFVLFWLLAETGISGNPDAGALAFMGLLLAVLAISNVIAAAMYMLYESPLIERGRALGRRFAAEPKA